MDDGNETKYTNAASQLADVDRCQYVYESRGGLWRCGLPAWDGQERGMPRCEFHSDAKPSDLGARLEAAVSDGRDLTEARLSGVELAGVRAPRARMHKAALTGARLVRVDLREVFLLDSDLAGVEFHEADLSGAELGNTCMAESRLSKSNLSRANLDGADLSKAFLIDSDLTDARLDFADLSGAWFQGVKLCNASLVHSRIRPVSEVMRGGADIAGARIATRPAEFREADLRGVMLSLMALSPETKLDGAMFGTDPDAEPTDIVTDEACAASEPHFLRWFHRHTEAGEGRHSGYKPRWCDCVQVYRQLRLCFQQSGDYLRAGEFFFREMHCLRRQMAKEGKPRWLRALWWLYEQVAGYGEWPGRVLVVMLLVVALCAGLLG